MDYKILAIIPARGGSKSVPNKNIKPLAGKPLIGYTIEEAKKAGRVSRIIVSTDCNETAEIARGMGAEVPFMRPKVLAEDHVQDLPVCTHALGWLKDEEGFSPDIVVWLRPTSPLRRAGHIDRGIEILLEHPEADSVRSVCPAPKHPLKIWKIEGGRMVPYIPEEASGIREAYNYPRQKLPPAYIQNGSVDVIRIRTILEKSSMTGDIILPLVMDEEDSVNIDTFLDFELAEIILRRNG